MQNKTDNLFSLRRLALCFAAAGSMLAAGCERDDAERDANVPQTSHGFILVDGVPCVKTDDLAGLQAHYRDVAQGHAAIARLPLTGAAVQQSVGAAGIRVCRIEESSQVLGAFNLGDGFAFTPNVHDSIVAHEYFHAQQGLSGGMRFWTEPLLTARDAAFAYVLTEATAVAYELIVRKEAELEGISYTQSTITASSGRALDLLFQTVYTSAIDALGGADTPANRSAALEYAGQAVVMYLLEGSERTWAENYARQTAFNMLTSSMRDSGCGDAYVAQRDHIFYSIGRVSADISLVPARYLGSDADANILGDLNNFVAMVDARDNNNRCPVQPPRGLS